MPATVALAQRIGGELLTRLIEEDNMQEEDEVARVEAFCLKKDWVPKYTVNSPLRFLRVENNNNNHSNAKKEDDEEELLKKRLETLKKSRR